MCTTKCFIVERERKRENEREGDRESERERDRERESALWPVSTVWAGNRLGEVPAENLRLDCFVSKYETVSSWSWLIKTNLHCKTFVEKEKQYMIQFEKNILSVKGTWGRICEKINIHFKFVNDNGWWSVPNQKEWAHPHISPLPWTGCVLHNVLQFGPEFPAQSCGRDVRWRWMRHLTLNAPMCPTGRPLSDTLLWSPGDCLEVWINNKTAVIAGVCVREGYSPRTHYYEAPVTVWKRGWIAKQR